MRKSIEQLGQEYLDARFASYEAFNLFWSQKLIAEKSGKETDAQDAKLLEERSKRFAGDLLEHESAYLKARAEEELHADRSEDSRREHAEAINDPVCP